MDCGIIDECRCFAYDDVKDPKKFQFCGVLRGNRVETCPPGCCAGGCPGQSKKAFPREPFRVVKRPHKGGKREDVYVSAEIVFAVFVLATVMFLLFHDLKINRVRKV